jgi:hypothetical protein
MILKVELLPDSWMWRWEIRSEARGELIESSWTATWTAYATHAEAVAAGRRRMAELRLARLQHCAGHASAA